MKIHYLQHVPFESVSMIADWAQSRGHTLNGTKLYQSSHRFPEVTDFDMLIVMGGPMSVHDEASHPWLVEERALIQAAMNANKYVFGICLGAQQIAKTLDAQVYPNTHKEIGWYPVTFTEQALNLSLLSGLNTTMTVLHWHGEQFDIPPGAVLIASSTACANQGFVYGEQVLGLQFHLEMNESAVHAITQACGHELVQNTYVQTQTEVIAGTQRHFLRPALYHLLDNWLIK